LFAPYAAWCYGREQRVARAAHEKTGVYSELLRPERAFGPDKLDLLPRVLPFVILLTGAMIALYGGYATPSATAGLCAGLALALIALIYRVWTPHDLEPILTATLWEFTILILIVGMSLLYSFVMSYLHISQSHPDDGADHSAAAQGRRFDLIWFGVVTTIVTEIGLIHQRRIRDHWGSSAHVVAFLRHGRHRHPRPSACAGPRNWRSPPTLPTA
jgi:TRAP-type C4-dicarboxylate transport system permease large subunit